jgi:hypothetical protein
MLRSRCHGTKAEIDEGGFTNSHSAKMFFGATLVMVMVMPMLVVELPRRRRQASVTDSVAFD